MPIDTNLRRTAFDRIIVNLRNFPRLTVSRKSLAVASFFSDSKLRFRAIAGTLKFITQLPGY